MTSDFYARQYRPTYRIDLTGAYRPTDKQTLALANVVEPFAFAGGQASRFTTAPFNIVGCFLKLR